MKKLLFALMPLAAMVSCSEIQESSTENLNIEPQPLKGVVMQVADIPFAETTDNVNSRSAMAVGENGLTFTWSVGDKTGVYSSSDGFALFNLTAGAGTSSATFDGDGFSLTDGATYYSFFPYAYAAAATDKKTILVDFSGQELKKNDDMESPMTKDYLHATGVADAGNALFRYEHLGSFVRTKLTMPASTSVQSVDFIPMYSGLTQTATVDVTADTNPLTVATTSPKMTLTLSDVAVPSSGELTLWSAMAPQNLSSANEAVAIVAHSGENIYSARVAGKNLQAGKAYRWTATPIPPTGYEHGLTVNQKEPKSYGSGLGEYSAITWLGDNHYAVVHDKENGGGIVLFDFAINTETGAIGDVTRTVPTGTSSSAVTNMDNEGIAYYNGKLYVSAEGDQSIREYDMTGAATGNSFTIPDDMAKSKISSNMGFEAFTFNATTGLFWTTTEGPLPKDNFLPRLHRLQSFNTDGQPSARYLYQMDKPLFSNEETVKYVYGISAMTALDDGRLVVLEREVYVPFSTSMRGIAKLYVVDPVHDTAGILRKSLLTTIDTDVKNLANFEGMCLGPTLSDGSRCLVLICDSQESTREYLMVVTIK